MPDSRAVCVVDTSVLVDMHVGGLLRVVFDLPLLLVTPDVLLAELQEPDSVTLAALGLMPIEMSSADVREVYRLATLGRGPSINDLFALVTAKKLGATLLTGDRHLREMAEREGVGVHGTLWLVDEMVRLAVAPSVLVAQALERMLERGSRLPVHECHKRIELWRLAR